MRRVALIVALVSACELQDAPRGTPPAAVPAVASSDAIAPRRVGDTLEFGPLRALLPAGARVASRRGVDLGGALVELDERASLEIALLGRTSLSLDAFVDSIQGERDAGTVPSSPDDVDYRMGPKAAYTAGEHRGWRLSPPADDCSAGEVYLAVGDQIVVAEWCVDGLDGKTIEEREEAIRALIATLKLQQDGTSDDRRSQPR